MHDDEPRADGGTGAIDQTFDESERPPADQLRNSVSGKVRDIAAGDIAIDLINQRPVYVVERTASTLVDHFDRNGWNILEYKHNPYIHARLDEPVLEVAYIPTKPTDVVHGHGGASTGDTYDMPRSRLMRAPMELITGGMRPSDELIASAVASMLRTATRHNYDAGTIESVARDVFDYEVAEEALERAGLVGTDGNRTGTTDDAEMTDEEAIQELGGGASHDDLGDFEP